MKRFAAPGAPVLVVDDDPTAIARMETILRSLGLDDIVSLSDSRQVAPLLERETISVALIDVYMPVVSGWDLLPILGSIAPATPVIIISAVGDIESAVRGMRAGAFDYVEKPVTIERLSAALGGALELWEMNRTVHQEHHASGRAEPRPDAFEAIITRDSRMTALFHYVEAVAPTSFSVLVTGESGTGKELFANSIHVASGRAGRFTAVNVAGLNDDLFSDTLFGHRKGAFTGADSDRKGMISRAANGTLFLDEIGDLSMESQIKLLRLLQENVYYPLGTDDPVENAARLVFATNHDLQEKADAGTFRRDLYFRLQAHHIHIPPLRERAGDLPLLVETFLRAASMRIGRKKPTVPSELYELLGAYDFPGNVRELEGMVNDAMIRHERGVLSLTRFRTSVYRKLTEVELAPSAGAGRARPTRAAESASVASVAPPTPGVGADGLFDGFARLPTLRDAEASLIREALRRAEGNQSVAAGILGISRQALNNRLRRGGVPE